MHMEHTLAIAKSSPVTASSQNLQANWIAATASSNTGSKGRTLATAEASALTASSSGGSSKLRAHVPRTKSATAAACADTAVAVLVAAACASHAAPAAPVAL